MNGGVDTRQSPAPGGPPLASSRLDRNHGNRAGDACGVTGGSRNRVGSVAGGARVRGAAKAAAVALLATLLFTVGAVPVHGSPAAAARSGAEYLAARQTADGGFAEPGRSADPSLTAWVVLALAAAGRDPAAIERNGKSPADYLAGKPYPTATDLELRILALDALGKASEARSLAIQLESLRRPSGAIGPGVNSTIWGILALRSVGRPVGTKALRYLLAAQTASGGWSWQKGVAADSNDTAAAVQAIRAAGVARNARAVRRALSYLRTLRNADGGFELSRGRGSDAQSTAWSIQAFLAAGRKPGEAAFGYLARLRRQDGSYRYSARYATTPVWVTAQVLPALSRRPFPLR